VAVPGPSSTDAPSGPVRGVPVLLALVAGTLAIRIPALLAEPHLGFDDGVYGSSALAMRAGEAPFRDIFSSQGPLFLPLVFVADLLGLRTLDAPRLLPLAAGAVLVAATWAAARELQLPSPGPGVAAGLVATSGIVLWVTGPITGDGPALALATTAVALTLRWRRAPSLRLAAAVGLALGAALSVKSLVVPAAIPIGWMLLGHRRHLGVAVASAMAVGLGFTLLWGPAAVWDQSVRYHLNGGTDATPLDNVAKVASTLGDRDLLLLSAAAAAGILAARWARRRPAADTTEVRPDSEAVRLVAVWLGATYVALVVKDPLYRNHISALAPSAALLVGLGVQGVGEWWRSARSGARVVAVGALVVVAGWHVGHVQPIVWPSPPAAEAAARADLAALPDGAWAISDEPGLVWREGRRSPSDLVDASITRIRQDRITAASLARAAAEPQVCAVLVWSFRYDGFRDLPGLLRARGYQEARRYDDVRVLYVKDPCVPQSPSS
jgi:hypothetical protein